MQNFLRLQRNMATVSKSTLPRIFSTAISSMFSLINRSLYILRPTRSRDRLATFGAPKILSFSKVRASSFCRFPLFLMSFQIFMEGSGEKASSWHLSQAYIVGFASSSRCPLFQELPRLVVVDRTWTRLSQRGARGWAGVRLLMAVLRCIVLLIWAYAFVLRERYPTIRCAALSHIQPHLLTST